MSHEPARKRTKKWVARKIYICEIMGESCDGEIHYMNDKGPVCEECEVYKEWKDKINEGDINAI